MLSSALVGLRVGSQGPSVTSLQQALLDAGINVRGGADGVYGPATHQAVLDFQRSRGLPATGEVDAATSAALADDQRSAGDATAESGVGLRLGTRGPQVTALQEQLIAGGVYLPGGPDGVFGVSTERAITQFQRWNGLNPTGVVDSETARRLEAARGRTTETAPRLAPNPPAANDNAYVGLARGARGPLVKELQEALQSTGLVVRGGADGIFGSATESALKAFQSVNGIAQTGVLTAKGARVLGLGRDSGGSTPDTPPTTPESDNPYVGLKVGSSGPLVRELQLALQNTGLVVRGGADGSFGNATRSALIAFQSVNGIEQTGIVTLKGAKILGLGTGSVGITNPNTNNGGTVQMERFPVQGQCFYGDTWHAARGGGRLHVGVDIIAAEGKLLYAVVDGEISKLYWDQPGALAGNGLRVAQPNGTYFTYLHMQAFAPGIELGTKVKAGDVIGFVGNTGSSATPHLHFEIHPNGGAAINPYPLVKAIDDCGNTTPQYQSSFA